VFLVLQACIGRGAHGLVFEGETSDGKAVAVKITPVNEPHNVNELAAVSDEWGRAGLVLDALPGLKNYFKIMLVFCAHGDPGPTPPLTSPCL
jgi:hypothetical protein